MYLFNCHSCVVWYTWTQSLRNLHDTKMHITVPRMNWAMVDALFHVCVLYMTLQTVMSSTSEIDTVGTDFRKEMLWIGQPCSIRTRCAIVWIAVNATGDDEYGDFRDVHDKENTQDYPRPIVHRIYT